MMMFSSDTALHQLPLSKFIYIYFFWGGGGGTKKEKLTESNTCTSFFFSFASPAKMK